MPRDKAEGYARGLLKLTKWVKISVKPERITSFDIHLSNSVDLSCKNSRLQVLMLLKLLYTGDTAYI